MKAFYNLFLCKYFKNQKFGFANATRMAVRIKKIKTYFIVPSSISTEYNCQNRFNVINFQCVNKSNIDVTYCAISYSWNILFRVSILVLETFYVWLLCCSYGFFQYALSCLAYKVLTAVCSCENQQTNGIIFLKQSFRDILVEGGSRNIDKNH